MFPSEKSTRPPVKPAKVHFLPACLEIKSRAFCKSVLFWLSTNIQRALENLRRAEEEAESKSPMITSGQRPALRALSAPPSAAITQSACWANCFNKRGETSGLLPINNA